MIARFGVPTKVLTVIRRLHDVMQARTRTRGTVRATSFSTQNGTFTIHQRCTCISFVRNIKIDTWDLKYLQVCCTPAKSVAFVRGGGGGGRGWGEDSSKEAPKSESYEQTDRVVDLGRQNSSIRIKSCTVSDCSNNLFCNACYTVAMYLRLYGDAPPLEVLYISP